MSCDLLVGVADSGLDPALAGHAVAAAAFVRDPGGESAGSAPRPDAWGHGSVVARTIMAQAPGARLLNAQVFADRPVTTPVRVAAALDWLVSEGAHIVNLSLGLHHDRPVLRDACQRAVEQGAILLAASPARGAPVYPAAYQGVIRVTGDARCRPGEISRLATVQADYGACPQAVTGCGVVAAGASMAVAQLCGWLAARWGEEAARDVRRAVALLDRWATYHGPEQRGHADGGFACRGVAADRGS